MKPFERLRAAWPVFIYKSYDLQCRTDAVELTWHFSVPGLADFHPTLSLPLEHFTPLNDPLSSTARELAFTLGMVELVSYWKATCSPCVVIECGYLDHEQILWWKQLYFGGLGEFFYRNEIHTDFADFMSIDVLATRRTYDPSAAAAAWRSAGLRMIPVGGGKDSVVTLQRTAPLRAQNLVFGINPTPAAEACMEIAGYGPERQVKVRRTIDPHLLDLNRRGFLNGHTPFSAVVAFVSYFCAYLLGAEDIILSNEASANEASVPGTEVNHQFSKTSEFEEAFQSYTRTYLGIPINYFSLLRPFNELSIARDFASYPQYFEAFRSCNAGSKQNVWCGVCAKCLFTAVMLAPFIGFEGIRAIFGKDLFADAELGEILDQLDGAEAVKAFECVGTVSEVCYALNLLLTRVPAGQPLPSLLLRYVDHCREGRIPDAHLDEEGFPYNHPDRPDPLLTFHTRNRVPEAYLPLLEGMNRPTPIHYLRGKKILILGYGREGKTSLAWLTRHWDTLAPGAVGVADQNPIASFVDLPERLSEQIRVVSGADYLEHLHEYDIVLKSPGIPFAEYTDQWVRPGVLKAFPKTEISGQVDLFLRFGPTRKVIGVTGTKGKSTTSGLIAEMLQQGGCKAALLGNIGVPIFDELDRLTADQWVVLELSSHQLQFVQASPHIAVITNFYTEHLDHYRSYDEYIDSKLNIVRFQQAEDFFVLNVDQPEVVEKALPLVQGRVATVSLTSAPATALFEQRPERRVTDLRYDGEQCVWKQLPAAIPEPVNPLLFRNGENKALQGLHFACDAALAAAAGLTAGLLPAAVAAGVRIYPGIPHRLEPVGTYREIEFYNDSIATIPEAARLAVETLKRVDTLLVGGMDRGLDYTDFADFLCSPDTGLRTLICLPDTGRAIAELCRKRLAAQASGLQILEVEEMEEAVRLAYAHTRKGRICLLSPAASSYNRYKDFTQRGEAFKTAVRDLADQSLPLGTAAAFAIDGD